jgi:hypothetical protein
MSRVVAMPLQFPLLNLLILMFLPGATGGLVMFLFAVKLKLVKNNKYLKKGAMESLGGAGTACWIVYSLQDSWFSYALQEHPYGVALFAALIGASWSKLLELGRALITAIIQDTFG